jgi:hypothetical protein
MRAPACPGLRGGRARALALGLAVASVAAFAQDEVPFITTPDQVTLAMLELAGVGPADHVIDLGSGDGRIVITAAKRYGARGLGVEIVPELVRKSRELARLAGVQEWVEFREQDLFATDLSRASVVTMYLLPAVNLQLRPRLPRARPGDPDRLARLGPGRLAAGTHAHGRRARRSPSARRSSRASTSGSCRRRCTAPGAPQQPARDRAALPDVLGRPGHDREPGSDRLRRPDRGPDAARPRNASDRARERRR